MRIPAPLQSLLRLVDRYRGGEADRDAAALAYGTLVATVPLITLAAAISSWILKGHEGARQAVVDAVERALPGGGAMVAAGIDGLGGSAATVTLVAGLVAALTSIGLVGRLRTAVERAWGDKGPPGIKAGLLAWVHDLVLGLLLAAVVATSALVSSLAVAERLPDWGPWLGPGVSLALGFLVDTAACVIIMTILPRDAHSLRSVIGPALAAGVALTALKSAGASLVRGSAERAGAGYGIAVGILTAAIAAYLAARILLLATYWAAQRTRRPPAGMPY